MGGLPLRLSTGGGGSTFITQGSRFLRRVRGSRLSSDIIVRRLWTIPTFSPNLPSCAEHFRFSGKTLPVWMRGCEHHSTVLSCSHPNPAPGMNVDWERVGPLSLVWHVWPRCSHACVVDPPRCSPHALSRSSSERVCERAAQASTVRSCLLTDLSAFLTVLHNGAHSSQQTRLRCPTQATLVRGIEAQPTFSLVLLPVSRTRDGVYKTPSCCSITS